MQDWKLDIKGAQRGTFDVVCVILMGLINKRIVEPLEYECEQRMQRERYREDNSSQVYLFVLILLLSVSRFYFYDQTKGEEDKGSRQVRGTTEI